MVTNPSVTYLDGVHEQVARRSGVLRQVVRVVVIALPVVCAHLFYLGRWV